MKFIICKAAALTLSLGVLLAAMPDTASAKAPPEGSYLQSCKNAAVGTGGLPNGLTASCRDRKGDYHFAYLPHHQGCVTDIRNWDGKLMCQRISDRNVIPGGSWDRSCDHLWLDQTKGVMRVYCEYRSGGKSYKRDTSIAYKTCAGPIRNFHGHLDCLVQPKSSLPEGSYFKTCRKINQREVLWARCRDVNGAEVQNTFDISTCVGPVHNQNGKLTCKRGHKRLLKRDLSQASKSRVDLDGVTPRSDRMRATGGLSGPRSKIRKLGAKAPSAKLQRPRLKHTQGAAPRKTLKRN